MYHFVCSAKYRRVVIDEEVDQVIRETCEEIEKRYEMKFIEVKDHVHFLIQSLPAYSPQKIIQRVKSIIAKEIFAKCPQVKKKLWGGEYWKDGYYVATVGEHGNEAVISKYVREQGQEKEYKKLYQTELEPKELSLWNYMQQEQPFDTPQLFFGVVHFMKNFSSIYIQTNYNIIFTLIKFGINKA